MSDGTQENKNLLDKKTFAIKEINFAIVHTALRRYKIFKFDNLKKIFPNLKTTREFITSKDYLGDIKIEIKAENFNAKILYAAIFSVLGEISNSISEVKETFAGTQEFFAKNISDIFHDKTVNYSKIIGDSIGISQKDLVGDLKIDLSAEDWFAYNDNFGTSEEKKFVAHFKNFVEELQKIYDKVYLVRNEREFKIYNFADGAAFEPDFVLFLQKNKSAQFEQLQIFIEPKGGHLLEKDAWKEKFLLSLENNAEVVIEFRGDEYKIFGLHFYNDDDRKNFDSDLKNFL